MAIWFLDISPLGTNPHRIKIQPSYTTGKKKRPN